MLLNEARAISVMEAEGLNGLLATSSDNVYYATGYWFPGYGRRTYALAPRERVAKPVLVVPTDMVDLSLRCLSQVQDVICHGIFFRELAPDGRLTREEAEIKRLSIDRQPKSNPFEALVEAFSVCDLSNKTVGIDEEGVTHAFLLELERRLPSVVLKPASDLFRRIRMVKTPEEIGLIRTSVNITEKALVRALGVAQEGVTELEMAREFDKGLIDHGALPRVAYLQFGRRGGLGNVPAADVPLKRGDVIRFDGGGIYSGYPSDIMRTPVFGPPSERVAKYYDALLAGFERALELIRPGVKANRIFQEAMKAVVARGLLHYRRHGIGHGLGLGAYNPPLLAPNDATVLEEGMVLCVEPPYYELGSFNLGVEDELVVTKDGYEMLSTLRRDLWVID